MLEFDEDESESAGETVEELDELELELDTAFDTENKSESSETETEFLDEEEIDLSDIEDMLVEDGQKSEAETDEELNELEFELEAVSDAEEESEEREEKKKITDMESEEPELEFELLDSKEDSGEDQAYVASSEQKPEEKLKETSRQAALETATATATPIIPLAQSGKDDPAVFEEKIEASGALSDKTGQEPVRKKRSVFVAVIVLAAIALLAGSALFVAHSIGINIPYISNYMSPKVKDAGNLKISTLDINGRYVENEKVGKLFVITGLVKNGYAEDRNCIKIRGKIYTKGNALSSKSVYCGKVLSDIELSGLDSDSLKRRLSDQSHNNGVNFKVEPEKTLPFMIVFSNPPNNLEEFTIEVLGSSRI